MIVNWNEWSDGGLTMHENIKGLSKETIRGWVRPVVALNSDGIDWLYSSIDCSVKGSAPTRHEAIQKLMEEMDAHEVDPYA